MSIGRYVSLAYGAALVAGCATGGFRQVSISAGEGTEPTVPLSGRSVFVVPNAQMKDTVLEARIRTHVEDELLAQGYTLVSAPRADLYVMASFGAVDRFALSSASIVAPAQTRTEMAPNGSFIKKVYPEHMEHPDILSLKKSLSVLISASDAPLFRETGQVRSLWQGEASTPGKPGLLQQMVPYLLTSTLKYFGKSSGGLKSIDVKDNEIRSWSAAR